MIEDRRARRGVQILHDPRLNKGTAFTDVEREVLGLRGLLPPRIFTQDEQEDRVLANLRRLDSALDKYLFLVALLDRNERLFYRTVVDNLPELLPVLYTPTVGEACRQFGFIFRRPRGLYVSAQDRGRRYEVENQYVRSVKREGTVPARNLVTEVFRLVDRQWRGIGQIPGSGLGLREEFADFDAEFRFGLTAMEVAEPSECRAGDVLRGQLKPFECPAFGGRCTPEHPLGAPMVSSEGACAAYYNYARFRQAPAMEV